MTSTLLPLVGVTACRRFTDSHPYQKVTEKYVTAVVDEVGACPVIIPALETGVDLPSILARLDGVLLTGSPSNLEPRHYGGGDSTTPEDHDPARDALTLPLVRATVAAGLPLLGLCRGIQEINVAFGGTLHQEIHSWPRRLDHRMRRDVAYDLKYRPAHPVELRPGGLLERIAGPGPHLVNSLHGQGLDRLGDRIEVEATAPDGVIEAISVRGAAAFALGVQWHPEWPRPATGIDRALLHGFGDALRRRAGGALEPAAE